MDRDLVERAMAGDHDAFSELARVSAGRLYAVARPDPPRRGSGRGCDAGGARRRLAPHPEHCATPIGSTPGFTRCWCGRAIAKRVGTGRCEASTSPSGCSNSLNRIDPSISPIVTSSSGVLPGSISISDRSSSCTTTSDCAWMRWPRPWATRRARSDRDSTGRRRRCALRSRRTPGPDDSPGGRLA